MDSNSSPNSPKGKSQEFVGWRDSSCMDKTYACAFCKRGFSNAQALGGHMNIHRRDRAKLKQAASLDEENLLSLEITSSTNPIPSDHHSSQISPGKNGTESSPGDGNSVIKQPEEVSLFAEVACDIDGKDELQQLPLFVDDKVGIQGNAVGGVKEKKMQLEQDVSSQSQAEVVDLELRLGPDPLVISGNMLIRR